MAYWNLSITKRVLNLFLTNFQLENQMNTTDTTVDTNTDDTAKNTNTTPTGVVTTGAPQPVLTPEQKAEQHLTIKANFDNKVDVVETTFHFRKVTDPETKIETKRNSVVLPLPVPSVEGIIAILETGGKSLELLQEAVRNVIEEQAREYINANEDCTALNFPFATLNWETIANLPKADRRGGGISKEVWDEFAKDYIAIMPALINKSTEAVSAAAGIFLTKYAKVKQDKKILNRLKEYLAIYLSNTARGEEFAEAVDWLNKKATTLIEADNEALFNAL